MKSFKIAQKSYAETYVDNPDNLPPTVSIEVFYDDENQGWSGSGALTFECNGANFTLDPEQLVSMLGAIGLKASIKHSRAWPK